MLPATSTSLQHLAVTSPSVLYHGLLNLYRWYTAAQLNYEPISNKPVIIFIPGRGGHYTDLIPLIDNLRGHPQLSDYTYRMVDLGNTRYTSIDTDVDRLRRELDKYPGCTLTLIGLSKGGVVATRYVTTVADPRVTKVITLSSPLQGTSMATFFFPSTSVIHQELRHGSDLTSTIAKTNFPVPIYHVVPQWDNIIVPTESSKYDFTPETNIFYYTGYNSHMGICYSPEVSQAVAGWIT